MSNTTRLLIAAGAGFVVNVGLTPIIIWLSHRNRWYDEKNHRKIHTEDVPRLGGVGILLGFLASLAVTFVMAGSLGTGIPRLLLTSTGFLELLSYFLPVIVGMIIVFTIGLIDDFRDLRAVLKLLVQIVAAVIVTLGPFRIERITIPFIWYHLELGVFSYPVTVIWIVAISNALNFIDGVDGLAGGIAAIAALFFGLAAVLIGQNVSALIAIGLFGSLLGFLVYNSPPARIFMGDGGSYVLGYSLAVIPLIFADGSGGSLDLIPAITVLAIPILDMTIAVFRRMTRGKHPFSADREHIHHKLLDIGLSSKQIVVILCATGVVLGATAIAWHLLSVNTGTALTLAVWLVCLFLALLLSRSRIRHMSSRADGGNGPQ